MILFILILLLLIYVTWLFGTRNFGYWKKKGVKHDEPVFFFGNMYKQFTQQISFSGQIAEWYENFPEEKYVGVHMANDLGLVLRDPELIKRVLVTDFQHFHRRGLISHKQAIEPILRNLFSCDGDIWKLLRHRLTPAFSSAKIKSMFPLIERTAEKMLFVTESGIQDAKELAARYTTDVLGVCGFGLDFDSLKDESSLFRLLGKRAISMTIRDGLVHIMKRIAPQLFQHVNYLVPEIEKNTLCIVKEILKERNYEPTGRNDFIDFLLELKKNGKIIGESLEHFNPDGTAKIIELELDDLLIAAQVFIVFTAGFETSSSAMSFLLHELAFNPEEQERCHQEIYEVLKRYGGKLSYEAIQEMKYLNMALKEAMRLHPSPGFLIRKCVREYTFPGTILTIDEGVFILVPMQALHKNPEFFVDPETFRPDRFYSSNASNSLFMPFGGGPRTCIGERLGIIQSLTGVVALLHRYRVQPALTSIRWPLIDPHSFVAENIIGGLPLILVPREPAY